MNWYMSDGNAVHTKSNMTTLPVQRITRNEGKQFLCKILANAFAQCGHRITLDAIMYAFKWGWQIPSAGPGLGEWLSPAGYRWDTGIRFKITFQVAQKTIQLEKQIENRQTRVAHKGYVKHIEVFRQERFLNIGQPPLEPFTTASYLTLFQSLSRAILPKQLLIKGRKKSIFATWPNYLGIVPGMWPWGSTCHMSYVKNTFLETHKGKHHKQTDS